MVFSVYSEWYSTRKYKRIFHYYIFPRIYYYNVIRLSSAPWIFSSRGLTTLSDSSSSSFFGTILEIWSVIDRFRSLLSHYTNPSGWLITVLSYVCFAFEGVFSKLSAKFYGVRRIPRQNVERRGRNRRCDGYGRHNRFKSSIELSRGRNIRSR